MNDYQPKLPLPKYMYAVVLFAGLYWGISFQGGAFGRLFALLLPPGICMGTAIAAAEGDKKRFIAGAITLYLTFLFTFTIGYGLATAGIIQFSYSAPSQKPW